MHFPLPCLIALLAMSMPATSAPTTPAPTTPGLTSTQRRMNCPRCNVKLRIDKTGDKPGKLANIPVCFRQLSLSMVVPDGGFWDYVANEPIQIYSATDDVEATATAVVRFEGIVFDGKEGEETLVLHDASCDVPGGHADLDCGKCEPAAMMRGSQREDRQSAYWWSPM